MSTLLISRTEGTGSLTEESEWVNAGETDADLGAALLEHALVTISTTSAAHEPLVMTIRRYEAVIDELASDGRWQKALHDPTTFDLLDRLATEALAEDDAGLTLDLDELLS